MNKDYIYSLVCEMADADGIDARDFVEQLYAQRNYPSTDGLPENVISELNDSRKQRNDERYRASAQERMKNDIARFRADFPNVAPEEIPAIVWESVGEGAPLAAAYALWEKESGMAGERAKDVNALNTKFSPAPSNASAGAFVSATQLEKMTPAEVKKNYRQIIASMKKW